MSSHHAHDQNDAQRGHAREHVPLGSLGWAVVLTLGFAAVELAGGLISGSLALLSDATHMVTDSLSLLVALAAQFLAKREPTAQHSYGHGRIEALAAFVNSLAMLALVGWIAWEAIGRMIAPEPVYGLTVIWVAAIGLAVNLVVAWVLSRDRDNLNVRAALVHVLGDLLGSVAALVAGVVIVAGGPVGVDPWLSLLVCVLILKSTFSLLRHSYRILMEYVPDHVDFNAVAHDLAQAPDVQGVHNLHIWELSPGHIALTAHMEFRTLSHWPATRIQLQDLLRTKYGIDHATIQPEITPN